uniref:Lol5 n=1 Tax=Bichromomyia olmeca TaxID=715919 RepID=A0A1B1V3E6_9DIPT|nr:Lol5 [Bichromomyia olmeca]
MKTVIVVILAIAVVMFCVEAIPVENEDSVDFLAYDQLIQGVMQRAHLYDDDEESQIAHHTSGYE